MKSPSPEERAKALHKELLRSTMPVQLKLIAAAIREAGAEAADRIEALEALLLEWSRVGKIVLDGLHAHIYAAPSTAVPVFNGIAALHQLLCPLEATTDTALQKGAANAPPNPAEKA